MEARNATLLIMAFLLSLAAIYIIGLFLLL